MMRSGKITLLFTLCAVALIAQVKATEDYTGRYICKQVKICDNSDTVNITRAAADAALVPVKSLLAANPEDIATITDLEVECIADGGCCCKHPISITLTALYKDEDQLAMINNWVATIKNGTGTLFPTANCIVDNSDQFSAANDKCIQPDMTGDWPVVCREYLGCSTAETQQAAIENVQVSMQPWFDKWNYSEQLVADSFFVTTLGEAPRPKKLATCDCAFVVDMALQLPVDPLREEEITKDLDEFVANDIASLDQWEDGCPLYNNMMEYSSAHRDTCDNPNIVVPAPPPAEDVPTAPWCKMYYFCSNSPDFDWPANEIAAGIKRVFEKANVPYTPGENVVIEPVDGNTIAYNGKSCTCSLPGVVKITLEAVTYPQTWILYLGFLELMREDNPELSQIDCIIDAYKLYVSETPACQVAPEPNFFPPAGPPIVFSPPPPPPAILPVPTPPNPGPDIDINFPPPPSPASIVTSSPPPPPSIFPFICVLRVQLCDNSIDWAWTDTKLRLNAANCRTKYRMEDVSYATSELSTYPNCRCTFPGELALTFPAGVYLPRQMDDLMNCIHLSLKEKYTDSVCVAAELSASCAAWNPQPRTTVVNGRRRMLGF